jgi:hypothetical protein
MRLDMSCGRCWTVLGEGMKRSSKFRAAVVLFLLALLLGGSATLSVTAAEITFVLAIVTIAIVVVGSIIKSKLDKKRKQEARTIGV